MTHLSEGLGIRDPGQYIANQCLHAGASVAWQIVIGGRSASCFTFAYAATRNSANRIDIKITIAPVAKTNRSANKRRIGVSLDEAIALGMVLRQRHIHIAKSLLNGIHHHVRPADEVLMVGIRRWQM